MEKADIGNLTQFKFYMVLSNHKSVMHISSVWMGPGSFSPDGGTVKSQKHNISSVWMEPKHVKFPL